VVYPPVDCFQILTPTTDQMKLLGAFCEKTAAAFFDAIYGYSLAVRQLVKNELTHRPTGN